MKSVVLGTGGHVDHGKTVLVEALTGINTDRWEEERRRGITIDLGFAPLSTADESLRISIVDVPGHEDFVKNMLAGATGLDLLLLVVAADEGPMPQTREHLWIAQLLGMQQGVVAITKSDLVDPEWLSLAEDAVREELERVMGHSGWPIVPVSGRTGEGVDRLRQKLLEAAREAVPRPVRDLFRMPVDRSFTVRGVGTVVTGTVASGRLGVGGRVRILPRDRESRVRGLQVHGRDVESVEAGQRAAVALADIDREEVGRGDVLTDSAELRAVRSIDAHLRLIPDARWPVERWQRVRLHLGTAEVFARVVPLEAEALLPGEAGPVNFRVEEPVIARGADRFVVRFYSPVTTIGGGLVLDPWAPSRGRPRPAPAESPDAVLGAPPRERILQALDRMEGSTDAELAVRLGLTRSRIHGAAEELVGEGRLRAVADRWYATETVEGAREQILEAIAAVHQRDTAARGMDLESLRAALPVPTAVVDSLLSDLAASGAVRLDGSFAALADHRPRLSDEDAALAEKAESEIRAGHAAPPTVQELATSLEASEAKLVRILRFLADRGELVAVTPDLYLDPEVMEEIDARVRRFLAGRDAAVPAEFRGVIDVSRKYLIPILEHLDRSGVTVRTSSGRMLRGG